MTYLKRRSLSLEGQFRHLKGRTLYRLQV